MENKLFEESIQLEKDSLEFGFYWESLEQLLEQITSECREVQEAYVSGNQPHLKEEIGDLISAAISLSIFCNIDPAQTLSESLVKYKKRFNCLVGLVKKDGLNNLKDQPMEILLSYWRKAKILVESK